MSVIEIEPFAAGDMEGFGGIDRTEEIELAGFTAGSVAEHAATLARARGRRIYQDSQIARQRDASGLLHAGRRIARRRWLTHEKRG